jgi:hypothetical protein
MTENFFALGIKKSVDSDSGQIVLYGTHNDQIKVFTRLEREDFTIEDEDVENKSPQDERLIPQMEYIMDIKHFVIDETSSTELRLIF